MSKDLVSIITACYNSENHLSKMIDSVLYQEYENWELVITDDASTDNTITILEKYSQMDQRIKFYRLNINSGASKARNNSIKNAKGNYLAFLDSDDIWLSNKLSTQVQMAEKFPDCALFYSDYHVINEKGENTSYFKAPTKIDYNDLLKTCSIGCLTAFVNLRKTGKIYMPDLRKRQDFAYWLKILRENNEAIGINKPLAKYRISSNSISSNKVNLIKYQWKVYYVIENLGVLKSLYYMINWAFYGVKKHYFSK